MTFKLKLSKLKFKPNLLHFKLKPEPEVTARRRRRRSPVANPMSGLKLALADPFARRRQAMSAVVTRHSALHLAPATDAFPLARRRASATRSTVLRKRAREGEEGGRCCVGWDKRAGARGSARRCGGTGAAGRMGAICSSEAHVQEQQELKFMLLGPPGVGKSTVFKQLTVIYENGFDDAFRRSTAKQIVATMGKAVLALYRLALQGEDAGKLAADVGEAVSKLTDDQRMIQCVLDLAEEDAQTARIGSKRQRSSKQGNSSLLASVTPASSKSVDDGTILDKTNNEEDENPLDLMSTIRTANMILQHPAVQAVLGKAEEQTLDEPGDEDSVTLPQSGLYYVTRVSEIAKGSATHYTPCDNDILRLRRITEEAASVAFKCDMEWPPKSGSMVRVPVCCTDVGGQIQHEYDWVQHGMNTTSVIFVLTLSNFCVVDQAGNNELKGAFALLRRLAASPTFVGKQFVILFNKSDLLGPALERHRVNQFFRSYMGDNSRADVVKYFSTRCKAIVEAAMSESNEFSNTASVSVVETCAVDSQLMNEVLKRVLLGLFQSTIRHVWN